MNLWAKIAWRNVVRNVRRSLITILAVTFGVSSLIFLWAFINGAQHQMSANFRQIVTGDLQIHPEGSPGIFNYNTFIKDYEATIAELKGIVEIKEAMPRLLVGAMISSAENSMGVNVVGLDIDEELRFRKKQYLVAGEPLRAGENDILMSEIIARQLDVGLGDKVVLLAQDRFGSLAGLPFVVRGFVETGSDAIDEKIVDVPMTVLQKMLNREGVATKILVRIDEDASFEDVVQKVKARMAGKGLEVSTWEESAPMLSQISQFQERLFFIVLWVVLFVVAIGVLNTLVMSYVERIREFGLMKALGSRDRGVSSILFWESVWLGLFGTVAGAILGGGVVIYFQIQGLVVSGFAKGLSNLFIGNIVYPKLTLFHIGIIMGIVMVSNGLAAVYPAWRVSRLEPVEAMRQVG